MSRNETAREEQLTISNGRQEGDVGIVQMLQDIGGTASLGRFQIVDVLTHLYAGAKPPARIPGRAFPGPQGGVVELQSVDYGRRTLGSPQVILGSVVAQQVRCIYVGAAGDSSRIRGLSLDSCRHTKAKPCEPCADGTAHARKNLPTAPSQSHRVTRNMANTMTVGTIAARRRPVVVQGRQHRRHHHHGSLTQIPQDRRDPPSLLAVYHETREEEAESSGK